MLIELLADYGLFFAKVATVVIAIIIVIGAAVGMGQRGTEGPDGRLEVKKINDRLRELADTLRAVVLDEHAYKQHQKHEKLSRKQSDKAAKKSAKKKLPVAADSEQGEAAAPENVYVLEFDGDMKASAVERLREEITAVLTLATSKDEVVVKLESPGGLVHAYGLAASQLVRFRENNIPLTVCVDAVAASGGYMMACIANRLVAAPFAVIGSIGVVASLPNFNKVLKKYDVDYELLTAGEYKRTLTMLGENTDAGRRKFIDDLEETHTLFKDFVNEYRPSLDIARVATGETWYGQKALEQGLVDELGTSDEYLMRAAESASVFQVKYVEKKNWQEKLGMAGQAALEKTLDSALARALQSWNTRH